MSIREYVINNFKDDDISELEDAINDSIEEGDEATLPGLGVLFELIWKNSTDEEKNNIKTKLYNSIKESV